MQTTEVNDLDQLSAELFRLTRLFERAQARNTAHYADGVERAAFLLLVHLVKDGPQRLSALAEAVHSDVSTVSRQVGQLVRLGVVERRADPTDGRAGLLAATAAGRENVEFKRCRRNRAFSALLADWSADDRHQLCELVGRFNDDFERYFLGEK
jgi:DNA-binding MarR family transcriptional regulator